MFTLIQWADINYCLSANINANYCLNANINAKCLLVYCT